MARIPAFLARLDDPLREATRREKRAVVGVSALAVLVSHTGLIPTEIMNLGIKFAPSQREAMVVLLVFALVYFLVAFVIYGLGDFLVWRLTFFRTLRDQAIAESQASGLPEVLLRIDESITNASRSIAWMVTPTMVFRILFDFVVPLCLGIYALMRLFLMMRF